MTAAPLLPEIKIDVHTSAEEARAFLERDRILAAYALADIDQPDIEGSRWWAARRDGEIHALVSAAGTHVRSEGASIAAVGNVLTRLAYRGRGMATSCTSAVTEAALEQHRDVVLNVRHDNAPAVAVYDRLGYRTHGTFLEGPAVRRAAWERLFGALKEKKG